MYNHVNIKKKTFYGLLMKSQKSACPRISPKKTRKVKELNQSILFKLHLSKMKSFFKK